MADQAEHILVLDPNSSTATTLQATFSKPPDATVAQAIARTVGQAEEDEAFTREADARWQRLLKASDSLPLSAAQAHLDARLQGSAARRR